MNPALVNKALAKVHDSNVLVNLISRRVRQLNWDGGGSARPLVQDVGRLGPADIALREIIEEKMTFEMAAPTPVTRPSARNRKRPEHWAKT
jgi:DNA-directed RNA polymerase subunit omega